MFKNKTFQIIMAVLVFLVFWSTSDSLLASIVLGLLAYFVMTTLTKKPKQNPDANVMPKMTVEKEAHYQQTGMAGEDINFFRETMAAAKKQILHLEKNMQQAAKLKAIDNRTEVVRVTKATFKALVDEPQKLHRANEFLYKHLPSLIDLTDRYLEINQHEVKTKDTYDVLAKSAVVIDQLAQKTLSDYAAFMKDDLEDMDIEIQLAKQALESDNDSSEEKSTDNTHNSL